MLVGRDLLGSLFVHDPFELYREGALTNPNMIVLGQIGRGKSAFVKSYLYRHAAFGRRIVVLDPKGEYGPLAEALGTQPIKLAPGRGIRLNPLDVSPRAAALSQGKGRQDLFRQRLAVLSALSAAFLGRLLSAAEHTALELALAAILAAGSVRQSPSLDQVVARLLDPSELDAQRIGSSLVTLRADGRDLGLELRRMVHGELAGMFDGPTSPGVDLFAPVVVLDLSAVYHSPALGALLACAAAALEASWRASDLGQTILVIDEAWAVLSNPGAARFFQSSFKLARAHGVANIAVAHRISDLAAAGAKGSLASLVAEGLLSDCETVVCYAQADAELTLLMTSLGLDEKGAKQVARLRRGVAYWRVGPRSFLVEHRLSARERVIVDTDKHLLDKRQR